jgi:malonyl-CoA decarboxylase
MQRQSFLGDLLATLWDRGRSGVADTDKRSITDLCRALMSAEGEVSGHLLAALILAKYANLDDAAKGAFFDFLCTDMDIDADHVATLAQTHAVTRTPDSFVALQKACEPKRQELLRRLNQPTGATPELVRMRVDLLAQIPKNPAFKRVDYDFVHLLRSWFNRGFLVLQKIDWNTPANILEKIVAYEAVHEIKDWNDLRRRVHPPDRRCFAFFHPAMPTEPLIFVEVALTPDIPGSIDQLLSENRAPQDPLTASTAVFYSISNCQAGLAGVSFGNLLIKQVAAELSRELPQLKTFATLSPIPGLMRWLKSTGRSVAPETLRNGAAHYLLDAKRDDGMPADPVTRFHLGNGAIVHAVHANADKSAKGMAQSGGVMVNYVYDLGQAEQNHEAFATLKTVAKSKTIIPLAKSGQEALKQGNPNV